MEKTVCFFGYYDPKYNRNQVLYEGLKSHYIRIIECHTDKKGFSKYIDLYKKHRKLKNNYDYLIVGFPGWYSVFLAKLITRKPVILDVFTSLYDSLVCDRMTIKKKTLKSLFFWYIDKLSCSISDRVLLDTNEHIDFFSKEYSIEKTKFIRIFVGSILKSDVEIESLIEKRKKNIKFTIHFHGSYIPLQGVEYILEAAKTLSCRTDIVFNIIGTKIKNKFENTYNLDNVNFIENVELEDLVSYMENANLCLGIFGDTDKARRVIPNKVFEAVACDSIVLSGESDAMKELFKNMENIVFCDFANVDDMVNKIIYIKEHPLLAGQIVYNVRNNLKKQLKPQVLVQEFAHSILNDSII